MPSAPASIYPGFYPAITSLVRSGCNFTLRQIAIIGTCQKATGLLTCADVARELNIEQVVVGRAVDLLEREGLLRREQQDTDRRKAYLLLTPAGKAFPA